MWHVVNAACNFLKTRTNLKHFNQSGDQIGNNISESHTKHYIQQLTRIMMKHILSLPTKSHKWKDTILELSSSVTSHRRK